MLNSLRKGAKSWVAKGLFFLLILSFGAWGIEGYLRPDPSAPAAEVGDLAVTRDELNRDFNRELEQLRRRFGNSIDREMAVSLGLVDEVLNRSIDRRLLDLEAHDLGVRVSDEVVREQIFREPAFTTATGQFDRTRFEQILFTNGLSEEAYVAMVRGDLSRALVVDAVASGARVPPTVAGLLYTDEAETRVAELAVVADAGVGEPPEPTEAQLAEAYEKDKARWMAPEYRGAVAVLLTPEDLMAEVEVDENRLREAYEARKAQFETPGTRNVVQLLFAEEAAARAASQRIAGGETFDAVAQELVGKGAERSEIGVVTREELFPAEVAGAAFGLDREGTTEPVRSPLGWHVLHVTNITPTRSTPFAEVRDALREEIARDEAVDRIYGVGTELDDALAGGATVEEIASQFGLKLVTVPPVSRQGRDLNGGRPAELPSIQGFGDTLFQTSSGSTSRLVETPQGSYFVLRVTEVVEARQRPLDEVREQVAQRWRAAERHKLAETAANALAEKVRAGAPLAAAAEEAGHVVRTTDPIRRSVNAPDRQLPAALVARIFAAREGEIVVGALQDGYAVARVASVDRPQLAADAPELASAREQLTEGMAADLRAQYLQALRSRFGVTVNQAVVQSLF